MRFLLLLLLSFSTVLAQEQRVLTIKEFGGLNTRSGDFSVAPNEFRQLDGVDLNANPGSITIRKGYDDQGTIAGIDSIIGIYGAYFSDGRQRLFYVVDSAGVGYGNIYATPFQSISGSQTRVATEWPVIKKPTFAVFQDKVYITNGNGRSLVYDNEVARDFPPYAPGEPTIVPLNTSGNLNGEYVYIFKFRDSGAFAFSGISPGEPSQRIKVQSGQVLLKDFTWMTGGHLGDTADSIWIRIYRTKANPGILDEGDTAYWVGTDIVGTSAANLATKSFIDSVADGSLNTDSFTTLIDFEKVGWYSGSDTTDLRYGAPWHIHDGNTTTASRSIVDGVSSFFWGYAYYVTYIDTVTNFESPLSPAFFFRATSSFDSLALGIPNPPNTTTGYKVNVYRQEVNNFTWDTTWQKTVDSLGFDFNDCVRLPGGGWKCYINNEPIYSALDADSLKTSINIYRIAQLDIGDTLFIDSITYDEMIADANNLYGASLPLTPMDGIVSLEDRLFGFYGSAVAISTLDSASRWFVFNRASVSAQDGQRIQAIWGQRDALRIGKTSSLHNFYQTADTLWNLSELTHYVGIVAPHSVAHGLGGTYYYTDFGVMRETEGLYRDRQFQIEPISQKVAALDTIPMSQKENAVGFYHDQMYLLSFPSLGDSGQTYVYFEKANAWARWPNLCFGGMTLYSTETSLSFLPGDTMYFFKPGGKNIYRYGIDTTDNLKRIYLTAETVPLLSENLSVNKSISSLGWGVRSTTTDTDSLVFVLKDEEGSSVYTDTLMDMSERYSVMGTRGNALYWTILFKNTTNDIWGNTIIDRLDIYFNETLKDRVK